MKRIEELGLFEKLGLMTWDRLVSIIENFQVLYDYMVNDLLLCNFDKFVPKRIQTNYYNSEIHTSSFALPNFIKNLFDDI